MEIKDVLNKIESLEREIKEEIRIINFAVFGDNKNQEEYPSLQRRLRKLTEAVEEVRKCAEKLSEFKELKTIVTEVKEYIENLKKEKELSEKYQKKVMQYFITGLTIASILGPAIGAALANALKGNLP